jgi:hypothetical protein
LPAPASAANAVAAVKTVDLEYAPRTVTFSRRSSVLDLFRAYTGERAQAALAKLFERSDEMFLQEPPLLLSDGIAPLRLTVRAKKQSERAPQFYIAGGSCTALNNGDDGAWVLEIVPDQGSLESSVTVLAGGEMIEYPLAVAPPLELFDAADASEGEAEYVETANRVANGVHFRNSQ